MTYHLHKSPQMGVQVIRRNFKSFNMVTIPSNVSIADTAIRAVQPRRKKVWSNEHKIKKFLLRDYDPTTRPVKDDSTAVECMVAISLYHILDTVRIFCLPHRFLS